MGTAAGPAGGAMKRRPRLVRAAPVRAVAGDRRPGWVDGALAQLVFEEREAPLDMLAGVDAPALDEPRGEHLAHQHVLRALRMARARRQALSQRPGVQEENRR
jgi:hypothetical protein